VDVCVVTFRNDASRIRPALRSLDRLWVRDNTEDNIGFAAAANELAAKGSDPIIVFVNPDLDPATGCFDELERGLDDRGRVAVGGSDRPNEDTDVDVNWLSGACLAIRRCAFECVGGFDPSLFMYGEDLDLSRRIAPLGRLSYIASAVYTHDAGRRSFRSEFLQARNRIVVDRRYGCPSAWWSTMRAGGGSILRGDVSLGVARIAGSIASVARH
jgi:GT2 family glycosyltransferase